MYYVWVTYCYSLGLALIAFFLTMAIAGVWQGDWGQATVGIYFVLSFACFFRRVVQRIVLRRLRSNARIKVANPVPPSAQLR
jgi:hypothetical protein